MQTALFIPIKLNNQRLPGKNLMDLNGRPLCSYIFETAAQLDLVDEKYVYCSDEKIAGYIPHGLHLLKRDPWLDGSSIKGTDIIKHFLRDIFADVYVLTHATQPFTRAASIETALDKVHTEGYDSAFSAVKLQDYCWYQGEPLNYSLDNLIVTQDLEPVYMETGAFFIFRREVFENTGRRIGSRPYMHIVDQFEQIDIDTAEDFALAQAVAAYLASAPSGVRP
ncbi:MAG: acylneuraminate cytidylyltransferase family protein [Clostridiales Family XIII bacterium]|jgi:CMP-N-acetylneuraminic acid synthetase|nr:acylneuraminate cytidylyltransferase family protein [Clostridiales Family XIII bacterium]